MYEKTYLVESEIEEIDSEKVLNELKEYFLSELERIENFHSGRVKHEKL